MDTRSHQSAEPENAVPEGANPRGKPQTKRNCLRWAGGGCLGLILILVLSTGVIYLTGALSGEHGQWNGSPNWSPDGSNLVRISPSTIQKASWPAWSPDGRQIVFACELTPSISDIFIMNADGTGLKQLTGK